MTRQRLLAFIDESGQRSFTRRSSDHFVMAAVALPETRLDEAGIWLESLRKDLRRGRGQVLHWKNYVAHRDRLRACQAFGEQGFGRALAVVTCKRELQREPGFTEDHAYMLSFRYLLERLTWLARQRGLELHYTLGHVRGFPIAKLREYEAALRGLSADECEIDWGRITDTPSRIERPENEEMLQVADIIASSIGAAFNADEFGNTEQRYVALYANRFYRGWQDEKPLTSYGLKMHPWRGSNTEAAYPWVAAL